MSTLRYRPQTSVTRRPAVPTRLGCAAATLPGTGRENARAPTRKNARLLSEAGVSLPNTGSAYFFARVPAARAGLRPPWPRPIDLASSERALA